jgi:hypothetical protein
MFPSYSLILFWFVHTGAHWLSFWRGEARSSIVDSLVCNYISTCMVTTWNVGITGCFKCRGSTHYLSCWLSIGMLLHWTKNFQGAQYAFSKILKVHLPSCTFCIIFIPYTLLYRYIHHRMPMNSLLLQKNVVSIQFIARKSIMSSRASIYYSSLHPAYCSFATSVLKL